MPESRIVQSAVSDHRISSRKATTVEEAWEKFWAERFASRDEIYPNSSRIVDTLLKGEVQGPILEVGGGSSRDSIRLAKIGQSAVVVDIAESALVLARAYAEEAGVGVMLVRGDANNLPFRDEAFGSVFHQGVLEHFENPQLILFENNRVLRTGGVLLVDVPQTFHPWTILKTILIPLGLWFGGWETQFTPSGLSKLVRLSGFVPQSKYGEWMEPSLAYRLLRELGLRSGLWRLPLYPRFGGGASLLRKLDSLFLGGRLELWTGYVVGILAIKNDSCGALLCSPPAEHQAQLVNHSDTETPRDFSLHPTLET